MATPAVKVTIPTVSNVSVEIPASPKPLSAVLFVEQTLTLTQQAQARTNIGALAEEAVSDWAKQPNKPTYSAQEITGLSVIIEENLAQAKASGEFDGEPGYTPIKGVDYFTQDDIDAMVAAVLAALPNAEEVGF